MFRKKAKNKIILEWLSKKFQDSQFLENDPFQHNSKITKYFFSMCTVKNNLKTIVFPLTLKQDIEKIPADLNSRKSDTSVE